jgi:hypothetical protein
MRLSLDQPSPNLASRQCRKSWLNFGTFTPTELITVPAMFRFSCQLHQLMTTAPLVTQFAAKEYLVFKIGSKPGSRIFAKVFNVLLLLLRLPPLAGSPIISPSFTAVASAPISNHLPHLFVAAGHESGRLLSALLPNIFGLLLLDSAFIHLRPPCPDLQYPVVKASSYDRGSNLFSPRGRRSRQRNINDIRTF